MKILIGCECSGVIRDEFIALGHDAWSCDLKDSERPGPHIKGDVLAAIQLGWDAAIFHPVCKFLAHSGAQWYYHPEDAALAKTLRRPHPLYPTRRDDQRKGIDFFLKLKNAPIDKIMIENPRPLPEVIDEVGMYSQIIQPYWFGDPYQKSTCLWLKGLPKLVPTHVTSKGEFIRTKGGKRIPKWYSDAKVSSKSKTETDRSRTFPGTAKAIAHQVDHFLRTGIPYGRLF